MNLSRKHVFVGGVILLLIVCAAVGAAAYMYVRMQRSPAQQEVQNIVAMVGEHMILPDNEKPTVATVSSLEQLAGQPFFANAKIGHKVLIYTGAQKAILYDPMIDKIVEVAPLNIQ